MQLLNDMHIDWDDGDNDTRPAIAILKTDGSGYWSSIQRDVKITELKLCVYGPYDDDEDDDEDYEPFGELRVHFNTNSWRPDKVGLIYTDKQFMTQLQAWLLSLNLDGLDVSYSEQGMQGDNYVSCDAGAKFIESWKAQDREVL